MNRYALGVLAGLATISTASALAADYGYGALPPLRPAYPQQWEAPQGDPLKFEVGVRYWYSIGKQDHSIDGDTQSINTKSHVGEVFAKVIDHETRSYAEAYGGYGVAHEGDYSNNGVPSIALPAARLGYAGLDFGWLPLGSDNAGFGLVTGYLYTNDSPDTGRANFSTAKTGADTVNNGGLWQLRGADSKVNNFDIHALKLGLGTIVDMGNFDISGEAAAIPYSWVNGTYGAYQAIAFNNFDTQGSATAVNGHAYGATGKLMVGFKPSENLAIRLGGRATYLTGQYDVTWDRVTVNQPVAPATAPTVSRQTYISNNNPFSMLRYGALVEIAGSF